MSAFDGRVSASLERRAANRVPPQLAAEFRRRGQPDDVFLAEGYRVIAHDRRRHGRSDQTNGGNEMGTYAADVAELVAALDLENAIHIGHSTGGGEVAHYVARSEPGRVSKAVLVDAVPPVILAFIRGEEVKADQQAAAA